MDCETFRRTHLTEKLFDGEIPSGEVSPEEMGTHLHDCRACSDWYQGQVVKERGEDPERYACVHLAYFVTQRCHEHEDPFDCPEAIVIYSPHFDEYGLPVRDGGSSLVTITHCPWCGDALPPSRRMEWFERLAALGIADPASDEVPEEFRSDEWWRGE